ncbi:BRISC and BRCA1-A complex member 2 isoform X1 [Oncorhynchus tshawytscha]|uniref:BRISC and BRCA1-A complex member 2 isoform X1 n=1 Tax=Oncorhynchus tshawytscha TaxID=74940 RepID=UPI001C3DA581|nr:BRISC and BRCA1-A complex member 2 isoform X1 [Oncorhynchus tshawytscha]
MNSMSPEVALNRISPELRPLLCSVVRNGRVGLDSTNCLRVTDLKTGCTSLTPGPCCDRFKLHIPYAGETLKWDIIFNARDPELPPDFIFGEDAEFLPEPSELPHLVQWDAGDPECLLQLVKELIQQYHQYQCQRLRESSRLLFEYDSLLEDPNYSRSMEIYAGHKNSWTGEFSARFLLKLPVDFSNIPVYLLKDTTLDPGEDVALLSVSFEDAEATQVFPKLYLSPSIEQCSMSFKATTRGESTLLPFSVTLECESAGGGGVRCRGIHQAHSSPHVERLLFPCPCGPPSVLPAGPAHSDFPVCVPLHQQWAAVLAGAEVLPLQPPLGRQRDGQASQSILQELHPSVSGRGLCHWETLGLKYSSVFVCEHVRVCLCVNGLHDSDNVLTVRVLSNATLSISCFFLHCLFFHFIKLFFLLS